MRWRKISDATCHPGILEPKIEKVCPFPNDLLMDEMKRLPGASENPRILLFAMRPTLGSSLTRYHTTEG